MYSPEINKKIFQNVVEVEYFHGHLRGSCESRIAHTETNYSFITSAICISSVIVIPSKTNYFIEVLGFLRPSSNESSVQLFLISDRYRLIISRK